MPGLRDLAAGHLAAVAADPAGVGEDVTLTNADGTTIPARGVWSQSGSDPSQDIGNGLSQAHGDATVRIPLAFVALPALDPAATVTRAATGEVWRQSRPPRHTPGVGWLLFLNRELPAFARGVR